ncbi:hypothetical protein Dimus_006713 [Dionaea muscipula]
MAANSLSLYSSSSTLNINIRKTSAAVASPQCVFLPSLPPPVQPQSRLSNSKVARNMAAMATGEARIVVTGETPAEVGTTTETPEIVKKIIEAWDKVEDKYAVISLALAAGIVLWGSTGLVAAIDRLPVVPGVFELVGIGFTGWFTYRNLIFKPDREELIAKLKELYKEILGSS